MSWIIGDGFDCYGAAPDAARGVWDTYGNGGGLSTPGRFATGQVLRPNGNTYTKAFPANESTVFVVFAYFRPGTLTGSFMEVFFTLRDLTTAQCTICMESDGAIRLRTGSSAGAVLATYPAVFIQDAWVQVQCRVVINNTTGSFTVRRNGSPTDSFTATGLNTRGGTANNYVNSVLVGGAGGSCSVDDLLIYSGSAPAPNDWVGDIRAIQMPTVGDSATAQYTVTPTALAQSVGECLNAAMTMPANSINFCGPLTVTTRSGGVDRVRMNLGSGAVAMTGHAKMAIYLNNGLFGPGTLVAVSQEVTNPAGGAAVIDFAFSPPAPWSWRKTYYLALLHDAAWSANCVSTSFGGPKTLAQSYVGGFPSVVTGPFLAGGGTWQPGGIVNITGHAIAVSDQWGNVPDTDYVSGTAGQTELYEMDDIVGTPIAVLGVVSKAYVKKSDAGTRTGVLVVKNGATEVLGVDTALSTTWSYLMRVDPVDPATGLAWTPGSFATLQVGTRVTS